MKKREVSQAFTGLSKKNISVQCVRRDPVKYFSEMPTNELYVLKLLLGYTECYKRVYVSQKNLAQQASLHRVTVNRILQRLQDRGLIIVYNRGQKKSCYYYFSNIFVDINLRSKLQTYFKRLPSLLNIVMLMSCIVSEKSAYYPGFFSESLHYYSLRNYKYTNLLREKQETSEATEGYKPFDFDCISQEVENSDSAFCFLKKETEIKKAVNSTVVVSNEYQKGKGRSMNMGNNEAEKTVVIPAYLQNIKSLDLTDYGRVCLSAYPQEVIEQVDQALLNGNQKISSPFGWFVRACKAKCDDLGIAPNWGAEMRLKNKFNAPESTPKLKSNNIKKAEKQNSSNKKHVSTVDIDAVRRQINAKKVIKQKEADVDLTSRITHAHGKEKDLLQRMQSIKVARQDNKPVVQEAEETAFSTLWNGWSQTEEGELALRLEQEHNEPGFAFWHFVKITNTQLPRIISKSQPFWSRSEEKDDKSAFDMVVSDKTPISEQQRVSIDQLSDTFRHIGTFLAMQGAEEGSIYETEKVHTQGQTSSAQQSTDEYQNESLVRFAEVAEDSTWRRHPESA